MPGWLNWSALPKTRAKSSVAETLKKLGILDIPPEDDILSMKPKRVKALFGYQNGSTKVDVFLLNVIWQIYRQIQVGQLPEFYIKRGYIRGMWYHLKPRLTRYKGMKGDHYGAMTTALLKIVRAGLCTYLDFNFRDRDEATYQVGAYNPHVLLLTEKDGLISVMDDLRALYGCTTITTGGKPSFMSTNYLVGKMVKAGVDPNQTFVCLSVVDFDPTGYVIGTEFTKQIKECGLRNLHTFQQYGVTSERQDLVQPGELSATAIATGKYTLKPKERRKPFTIRWAQLTGGVLGDGSVKYGLHVDEFSQALLHDLVGRAIAPHLKTPAETVRRRDLMRTIQRATADYLLYRLTHPTSHQRQPVAPPAGPRPLRPGVAASS
jgi:hypothetical protein